MDKDVPGSKRLPVGQIADSLGVRVSQAPDELVTDVLVIVRVLGADGQEWIRTGWNENQSWVMRNGMINSLRLIDGDSLLDGGPRECTCGDDDG